MTFFLAALGRVAGVAAARAEVLRAEQGGCLAGPGRGEERRTALRKTTQPRAGVVCVPQLSSWLPASAAGLRLPVRNAIDGIRGLGSAASARGRDGKRHVCEL